MSEAVSATGILVKRGTGTTPTAKTITSSAVGDPGVITATGHGFVTGEVVTIAGHSGSTPVINGSWVVTVLSANTFSIPIAITTGGTGGTAQGPESTEVIAEIVNVTPPGFSRNKLESTTHNEGVETYVLGILRQSDPAFRVNYVGGNVTHQHIVADILTKTKHLWVFQFPSGTVFQGVANVQAFAFTDAPPDAIQQANVTLSWAGQVTFVGA